MGVATNDYILDRKSIDRELDSRSLATGIKGVGWDKVASVAQDE